MFKPCFLELAYRYRYRLILSLHVELVYCCRHGELAIAVRLPLRF